MLDPKTPKEATKVLSNKLWESKHFQKLGSLIY